METMMRDNAESTSRAEAELKQHSERIDRLLDEIQALAGPVAWPRVEQLVRALMDLYGRGLFRVLQHVRSDGATAIDARLSGDAFVSGLLSLHGLHPHSLEQRVANALEDLERQTKTAPARTEIVSVHKGEVTVRLTEVGDAGLGQTWAQLVKRAILQTAPEVSEVHILGLAQPAPR